jgi:hypothetical protein
MKKTIYTSAVATLIMLSLSGCGKGGGNVRDVLGLDRTSPDEFTVVSRPPLTVPKEFYLLPPGSGVAAVEKSRPDEKAKMLLKGEGEASASVEDKTILDSSGSEGLAVSVPDAELAETAFDTVTADELPSSAEESLLNKVGANEADDKIRTTLKQEAWEAKQAEEKESVWDALKGENASSEEAVVDAPREAERIVANKQEGKAITEGDVELDDPADDSPLERFLKWF